MKLRDLIFAVCGVLLTLACISIIRATLSDPWVRDCTHRGGHVAPAVATFNGVHINLEVCLDTNSKMIKGR